MAAPQSNPYPPAPGENDFGEEFDTLGRAFAAALEPRRQELQEQADFVNDKSIEVEENAVIAANAAEVAEGASRTYDDTTAGLAATTSGQYFTVPSQASGGYMDLYKNNSGAAELKRTSASDQVVTEAETARDAAQLAETGAAASLSAIQDAAQFYDDIAAGLAGTVDTEYFRVMAPGNTAAILYRNNAGSEDPIGTFPTEEGLQAWEQKLRQDIIDLVKNPDEIPVKTVFFLGEAGSFIDVSGEGV